jgi:hypothetical protein
MTTNEATCLLTRIAVHKILRSFTMGTATVRKAKALDISIQFNGGKGSSPGRALADQTAKRKNKILQHLDRQNP